MQPTTYTVAKANKSHRSFSRAVLIKNGVEQTGALKIIGGSVTVDGSAAVRRRAKLSLAGYHPEVDPFTCEVRLQRSVDEEYVNLGVFRIEDPTFAEDRDGVRTEIEGYDRAYWLSTLRLPTPYTIGSSVLVHNAISALLLSRAPQLSLNFTPSTYTVNPTTFEELSDPWEKSLLMAESAGMELFFDVNGTCVLRPINTDVTQVVATYGAEARILKATKKQSTKNTYSRAIVTSENTSLPAPIRAEAVDNNPLSPTYYLGTFGDRPTSLRSQFITTQAQADTAAAALLARKSGKAETIQIEGIPNPAHDAGDMIGITRAALGINTICAVDTLDIPLDVNGRMRIGTRERRIAA